MIFSNSDPYGIEVAPRLKKVRVVSYFHSGLNAYDKGIAYMNIKGLKVILRQKNYTGIHIYSKTPFKDIKPRKFDIVVGKRLFDNMAINKNDKVVMIFSNSDPYGIEVAPRLKKVRVVSYFHSGLNAYDKGIAYMNIKGLKVILRQKNYTGIHIYSKTPFKDIKKIKKDLPFGVGIIGWWQQNGNFFSALKLEKRAMFLVLMLIIIVASLNIIGSLLMMIMNRRKEIALMMSLGASKKEIKAIFFRLGMVVGFFGIVAGISLGGIGIWALNTFDIVSLPADVYGTSKIPTDLSLVDFCLIVIGAVVVIMLSSFYPAKKASEVDILTTLRFE
jgi:putative ABC transport system permease protein